MTGTVQYSAEHLQGGEWDSFAQSGVVLSRDFGRGDGELPALKNNPAALALHDVLTVAIRPDPAPAATSTQQKAPKYTGLHS